MKYCGTPTNRATVAPPRTPHQRCCHRYPVDTTFRAAATAPPRTSRQQCAAASTPQTPLPVRPPLPLPVRPPLPRYRTAHTTTNGAARHIFSRVDSLSYYRDQLLYRTSMVLISFVSTLDYIIRI